MKGLDDIKQLFCEDKVKQAIYYISLEEYTPTQNETDDFSESKCNDNLEMIPYQEIYHHLQN